MDDSDPFANPYRMPTAARPLLGLTILVVEDSRYACEALRLMCLRSGARIRRADCLASAHRHLQIYRPSVLIVDLGLPDGSGSALIEDMADANPRIGVILGMSGDDFTEAVAISAGADGFLAKPIISLAAFQNAILNRLPPEWQPAGPRIVPDEVIRPDPMAYHDDIAHAAEILGEGTRGETLDYVAQFLGGVARSAEDHALADAAEQLALAREHGLPAAAKAARVAGLVQDRLTRREAI